MKNTIGQHKIRQAFLLVFAILLSVSNTFSQSYTIGQTATGNSRADLRGQIFIPSVQEDGSGTIPSDNTVLLTSFSVVYSGTEAPKLYIYSELPANATDLDNGTATGLVGESQGMSNEFPLTIYEFDSLELDKGTTYYALFRQDVDLEFGGSASAEGPYSGGKMIKNDAGTLSPNDYAALRFEAEFVRTPPNQQDVDALIALYNSTDGDNWDNSWDLEASPYEWYGVTWEDQRATEIKIESNSLNGSLPAEIGNLTELTSVRLSNNSLTGSIPAEIGNLEKLTELYLINNSLDGSLPTEIGNLSNLTQLYLNYNSLAGSLPSEIGNLNNLMILNLLGNSLTGSIPTELGDLTNLTTLSLHSNFMSGDIPTELVSLPNLNVLYLNNNDFENLPDFSSSSLSQFGISNNKFTFEDIEPNESVITDNTGQKPFSDDEVHYLEQDESLTLQFTVGGTNNTYQWQKSGENIDGEMSNTLEITGFSPATDTGTYQLFVNNTIITDLTLKSGNIRLMVKEGKINESDSLALVAMYNSADGANWKNNEGWLEKPVSDWYGVTVFNSRVVKIELVNNDLTGSIPTELGNLDNLMELRLGSNYSMNGTIPAELGNLSNLEMLNLSYNEFTGEIPTELANLAKLSYLDLSHNELTGSIPVELSNLTELTSLYLDFNLLAGSIPKELGNLIKLDHLDLSKNSLEGMIPAELGNLTNLISLNLGFNSLEGELPEEIGKLTSLRALYLGNNYHLSGTIPAELGNLTSLSDLALNYNSFEGAIPATLNNISPNPNGAIYFDNNNFDDLPEMSSWSPRVFTVDNNKFTFEDLEPNVSIITDNTGQKPFSDDEVHYLERGGNLTLQFTVGGSNNTYQWQKNGEIIEGEISNTLEIENFAVQADTGTYQLLVNNTIVTDLTLESGNIHVMLLEADIIESDSLALVALYNSTGGDNWTNNEGWLEKPVKEWYGVSIFDGRVTAIVLPDNELNGSIPTELGNLPELISLNLSRNSLSGNIPKELSNLSNLTELSLNNNSLSGPIPTDLGNLSNLAGLELEENSLDGAIPGELGNLSNLRKLNLSFNSLEGEFPNELGNLTSLEYLRLEYNSLSGSIPTELGSLSNLVELELTSNSLEGTIPGELGNLTNLRKMSLSFNSLEGEIPAELGNLVNLRYLTLSFNLLSGAIPSELGNLSKLYSLNLGSNSLEGELPVELGNLTSLVGLNLSGNHQLSGPIPIELGNLTSLENLILRDNSFEELPDLSALSLVNFDISNNKFTFEDMEPNSSVITENTGQQPFGEAETIDVSLNAEQTLTFDLGGTQNNYQWMKDGQNIAGANTASYTVILTSHEDLGEYKLLVTNDIVTGLTLESQPITIESSDIITGIEDEMDVAEMMVYPNPMQESTTLYLPELNNEKIDVQVFDLTGSEVPVQLNPIGNGKYTLSMISDKKGILMIKVNYDNTSVYKKIIKN